MKIKNNEKINIKRWAALLILWIIISVIGSGIVIPTFRLLNNGIKTTWIVTDLEIKEDDDTTLYRPKVKYNCNWIEQEQWHSSSSSDYNYDKWTTIYIYCDPEYPNNFLIKSNINYIIILCPIITIVMIIYWIKLLFDEYKKNKFKKHLKKFWNPIKGTVKLITLQKDNNITKYYTIIATDWNRDYISEKINTNIRYLTKRWDEIEILIDPINPDTYYINTDKILEKQVDELCVKDYVLGDIKHNNYDFEEQTWIINIYEEPNRWNNLNQLNKNQPLSKYVWWSWWIAWNIFLIIFWIIIIATGRLAINGTINQISEIIWIIIIIISWIYLYINIKKKKYIKNLKTDWIKINAIISEIEKIYWNNKTWYKIIAVSWNNIYKSPKIYTNVKSLVKPWDYITVLLDNQNIKKYCMDVDDIHTNNQKILQE